MVACRKCGAAFDDAEAKFCPKCGVPDPLSDEAAARRRDAAYTHSKPMSKWVWFIGVPVGLFALVMVFGSMNADPEKSRARQAYALCLDDLAGADRARSGTRGVIAGACESMRTEFVRKYGVAP